VAIGSAVGERSADTVHAEAVRIRLYFPYALGEDRDTRAFVRSHERGLLQEFGNIAVEGGVPADHRLKGYRMHLSLHRCRTSERFVWIEWIGAVYETNV